MKIAALVGSIGLLVAVMVLALSMWAVSAQEVPKVAPPKAATTEAQLTPAQKEEQERIRIYVNGLQSKIELIKELQRTLGKEEQITNQQIKDAVEKYNSIKPKK